MDRVQFACSIHNLSYKDIIYRFEELMILYNVLESKTGYTITNTSAEATSFSIDFSDCKSAEDFNNAIKDTELHIYDYTFLVKSKLIRNMLSIELLKQ